MLFIDSGPILGVDPTTFFWDTVNARLGLSEGGSPDARLHIFTGFDPVQVPTSDGFDFTPNTWQQIVATTWWECLNTDDGAVKYASRTDATGTWNFAVVFPGPIPATGQNVVVTLDCRRTGNIVAGATFTIGFVGQDGQEWTSTPVTPQSDWIAATFVLRQFTCVSGGSTGNTPGQLRCNLTAPAGSTGNRVDVTYAQLGGTTVSTSLQKWEYTNGYNLLDYALDANSVTTLQLSGAPKFRVAASGMEIDIGTPASGAILASTDTEGTVAWAAASSIATTVEHQFKANGFYKIDGDVDGAYVARKAFSLGSVLLYRRQGGTSGSVAVDLRKNGTTVLSTVPSIAFNAGASATASGIISVTSVAIGDRMTAHCTASDPRGQDYVLEFQGA